MRFKSYNFHDAHEESVLICIIQGVNVEKLAFRYDVHKRSPMVALKGHLQS